MSSVSFPSFPLLRLTRLRLFFFLFLDDDLSRILVRIHGDEYVTISMDPRSGRISARDAGDVVPSEDSRLVTAVKAINQDPQSLSDLLIRLKLTVSILHFDGSEEEAKPALTVACVRFSS